jgi:ribosomal protein S18 acetylase RimI-like enzyme
MTDSIRIRPATASDADTIIEFAAAMALETERKVLLREVIAAGVHHLLAHPEMGFYVMAEREAEVAGSLMVTTEWSDWRNGNFWWVQSVYVRPQFRRRGVYRELYRYLQQRAETDPSVCGFRLYVERDNSRAQATYRAAGMEQTQYLLFEELKPGVRFYEPAK